MHSQNVLITGSSGFVGRRVLAHFPKASRLSTRLDNAEWMGQLLHKHCVIHLAARVHQINDTAEDQLAEYRKVNTAATLELARQCVHAGVRRFVFLSSVKVNGESTKIGKPYTETDRPDPIDPYGVSKLEAEQGLMQIAQQTGMEVVVIRPPLVYGPGVKANFAALMRAVQRGMPLPLGAIHNARSLVGLDNLVDFIALCVSHPAAANQTFLVSDGQDISTSELVRVIAAAYGVADRQIAVPMACLQWLGRLTGKSAAVDRLCGNLQVDISKAKTLLSWLPPVSLEEGIRRTISRRHPAEYA